MSPQDEEIVERYVRHPATLSLAERERVMLLLRTDSTARRIASFYRGFYDELDRLDDDATADSGAAASGDDEDAPAVN